MRKRRLWIAAAALAAVASWFVWLLIPARRETPPSFAEPRPAPRWDVDPARAHEFRDRALREAHTWRPTNPRVADLTKNPRDPSGFLSVDPVECGYVPKRPSGTTPKFDCALADGEVVRVKYGQTKEIHAEVAGTRLLRALGFGADRVHLVPRLRCYGCPREPYYTGKALDFVDARELASTALPHDGYTDFEWVAVERRYDGIAIEADHDQGWAWYELADLDSPHSALHAERDALRLMAVLLAHWDNKASNQRLMCRTRAAAAPCAEPVALIQDLGSTFGPVRVDLDAWIAAPIWSDRARCMVSMKQFPYGGGTFTDAQISEAGRRLLGRQLAALDDEQLAALFSSARFPEADGEGGPRAEAWARALRGKIRAITDGAACPG